MKNELEYLYKDFNKLSDLGKERVLEHILIELKATNSIVDYQHLELIELEKELERLKENDNSINIVRKGKMLVLDV